MLRWSKKFLTMFLAGTIFCSTCPIDEFVMQVQASVDETQIETSQAEVLDVSFDNSYAEVGKELSVTVTGAEDVSYQWSVGGVVISNDTNSYIPTENDLEKWIEVAVTAGTETATTKLYCSKLPVVYIDTENAASIVSKEDYINATMKIQGNVAYNSATTALYDGDIEIRGRGNSTWNQPKKPYKIKLDKKTNVFGMGKNKHWVLLANYLDESLMRNTLSYDLSGSMGMEQMSTVWVDVVLNGEYVGNYQFCEQVRVDSTRVDVFDWEGFAEDSAAVIADEEGIDEDDLAEYMLENMGWITSGQVVFNGNTYQISNYSEIKVPSINGGYILELDEYYDEVSKFKTNSNQPIMFKNPEFANTNEEMMTYVQEYVQAFENAVQASDYTAEYEGEEVHYSDLYDLDALVDYWLVNEIFYNEELNKKSTYMYQEIGGLMIMGPIWDMDWSSGAGGTSATATNQWATLYFNTNAQKNQWYKNLVKDPYFLMKVQERYWEIRNNQVQNMLNSIDDHYEYLKESGTADTTRWSGRVSFDNDVTNLKNWLNSHIAWMDQKMITEDALDASFISKSNTLSLEVTDSEGNELEADTQETAPADAVITEGKDVKLTISGNNTGNAEIYVNGKKCNTIQVTESGAEYVILADKLTEENGIKNVVEVKIKNTSGVVTAENYVTVKEVESDIEIPSEETAIVTQPADYEGYVGETAVFAVEATGNELTYQWEYKNANSSKWYTSVMDGCDSESISVQVTNGRNGQQYRCIVADGDGNQVISDTATIRVLEPEVVIAITKQPTDCEGCVGETAIFEVEAAGNELTYQWQYQNANSSKWYSSSMSGNNTAAIQIPITNGRDGQKYRCIVTDKDGNTVTSESAKILVKKSGIVIITQPVSYQGYVGETAIFTVEAEGENLTYLWQYKNASASRWYHSSMRGNHAAAVYVPISNGRNGQQYRCLITDANGNTVITDAVTLQTLTE